MNFCGKCATSLSLRCPQCSFENPAGFAFCGKCATPLTGQTLAPRLVQTDKQEDRAAPEAERRQLTVEFIDLVGSTALSEQFDPEELREVVGAYQAACEEVIQHFGGYVARYMGDGLLVYFGYPTAQEDAPARAIRAGLGIVTAMSPLNTGLHPRFAVLQAHSLQVRIGIHTGLVVVGAPKPRRHPAKRSPQNETEPSLRNRRVRGAML